MLSPQQELSPDQWVENGIEGARIAGLLEDHKESSAIIVLSETLHDWKNRPKETLNFYGYLEESKNKDPMRASIFNQINNSLQDEELTKQTIIDAHSIVPISIVRYIIENFTSIPDGNNTFRIITL